MKWASYLILDPYADVREMIAMRDEPQKKCLNLLVACLVLIASLLPDCLPARVDFEQDSVTARSGGNQASRGCTLFTVAQGDRVFR